MRTCISLGSYSPSEIFIFLHMEQIAATILRSRLYLTDFPQNHDKELIAIVRRILIMGDNADFCDMLQVHLENNGFYIDSVKSITAAINAFAHTDYCLAVLNFQKNEVEGIDAVHLMRNMKLAPILVISDNLKPEIKVRLFYAGANVCIEMPIDMEVCIAQADALLELCNTRAGQNQTGDISFGTELVISSRFRQVFAGGEELILTRKEFELLYFLAKHPFQVFSLEQLYAYVWRNGYGEYGDNTVKVHIGKLRKKLNAAKIRCIENVWGIGYKFLPPNQKN